MKKDTDMTIMKSNDLCPICRSWQEHVGGDPLSNIEHVHAQESKNRTLWTVEMIWIARFQLHRAEHC